MADLAGPSTNAGARRFLARWDRRFHSLQSRVARYGLAIVSVTVALGLSLALQYYQFRGVEVPVLTLAIAVTTWYAGNGPAGVRSYCPRCASTTSLRSPTTPSKLPAETCLTFSFS